MSRLPPKIKQKINGKSVGGFSVQPLNKDGVTYSIHSQRTYNEAGNITGMDWWIEAKDATETLLWKTVYFKKEFRMDLETDAQESYPVDFQFCARGLSVEHESNGVFFVDLSGTFLENQKPEDRSAGGLYIDGKR